MRAVYIAHPLRGDVRGNTARASELCRKISREFPDIVVVCPLMSFSFLDDENPEERQKAIVYCLELLSRCDELWLAGDWKNSEGCRKELRHAKAIGIPVSVVRVAGERVEVSGELLGRPVRLFGLSQQSGG